MVARLPTEQEAVGSSPTSGLEKGGERSRLFARFFISSSFPSCRWLLFGWWAFVFFLLDKLCFFAILCICAVDYPQAVRSKLTIATIFFWDSDVAQGKSGGLILIGVCALEM